MAKKYNTDLSITEARVRRVLKVVDQGLSSGLGKPSPGNMCVEAAVCYAFDLPHGDNPGCVSNAVRYLKIALNDSNWSSKEARASGMRKLAIAQLGTNTAFNDGEFVKQVVIYTIKTVVPAALKVLLTIDLLSSHHLAIQRAIEQCEIHGTQAAVYAARAAANAAVYAARAAANAAAYAAARAAAYVADATDAADAAARAAANAYAANAAAYATDAANAAAYAAHAARAAANAAANECEKDNILKTFADGVVQILVNMNSEGSRYLYLAGE